MQLPIMMRKDAEAIAHVASSRPHMKRKCEEVVGRAAGAMREAVADAGSGWGGIEPNPFYGCFPLLRPATQSSNSLGCC